MSRQDSRKSLGVGACKQAVDRRQRANRDSRASVPGGSNRTFGAAGFAGKTGNRGTAGTVGVYSSSGFTGRRAAGAFTVVLFCLFCIAVLLALMAGTGVYRHVAASDAESGEERLGLSLISNAVRSADCAGSVSAIDGPEGQVLVLTERLDTGSYETRFYLSGGFIVGEYTITGTPINPNTAQRVAESDTFWFQIQDNLLVLGCDAGQTSVALRSSSSQVSGGGYYAESTGRMPAGSGADGQIIEVLGLSAPAENAAEGGE